MAKDVADYILAADNHNLGNGEFSWVDPSTWGQKVSNIGKFATASILSGANSFYNTAAAIADFIPGLDVKQNPTEDWISEIDSDLGAYYRQNKESVDLAGFVLGAIIPGVAGVKIFNAGQKALTVAAEKGLLGGNLGRATGLLTPSVEKYVSLAAADINASTTAVKLLNANTVKALGAGLWQNTLEAAAFETLVQATMFKSPVLDQQDVGDIMWNVAVGGMFGGVIGGAFTAAKIRGSLKTAVAEEDVLRLPSLARPALAEKTSPSDRIITLAHDAEYSVKPNFDTSNYAVKATLYSDKLVKDFQDIRYQINTLAKNDTELGNLVADISTPVFRESGYVAGFSDQYLQNYSGAVRILRATEISAEEFKATKALLKGEAPEMEVSARWVRTIGEGAGKTFDEKPAVLYLSDTHTGKDAIRRAVKSFGFSLDKSWDASLIHGVKAHTEAEARYIWAHHILKEIPDETAIPLFDIPLLERAFADNQLNIRVIKGKGPSMEIVVPTSKKELFDLIKEAKDEVAAIQGEKMFKNSRQGIPLEQGTEAIAKITNTKVSYLENELGNEMDDLFAMQSAKSQYLKNLSDRKLSLTTTEAEIDPIFLPKYAKIVYSVSDDVASVYPTIADAMVYMKEKQTLFAQEAKRIAAKIGGPLVAQTPDIPDRVLFSASRGGNGAGLIASENSNYGTLGSTMSFIGSITRSFKQLLRKEASDMIEAPLARLGQNLDAALEFESLNQKITRTGKLFVLREDTVGQTVLVERTLAKKIGEEGIVDFELLEEGVNAFTVKNREVIDFLDAHIKAVGKRTDNMQTIRAAQGKTHQYDPEVFRPIRPDLKRYPNFAFVVDERVTGAGHITMLHAASEQELGQLIDKARTLGYQVRTKSDVEAFKWARHEYEYSRTLNENYIDSELASKGIFSNFFPKSDPQKIVDDILAQHLRESEVLALETVRLRYEPQFNFLEDLGRQYSKIGTSQFATRVETLEKVADNPYFNYIKTALDISKINEHHLIFGFNKLLDETVSKAWGAIHKTFQQVKSPEDLTKINALLDQYGMKPGYYDAGMQALANHSAPKGVLTKFVRQANSLLSLFTLGLDPLNSLNNAIGSNILRTTELKHLTRAIAAGDSNLAGELAQIGKVRLPGVEDEILAPSKLVAKAIQNFWSDTGGFDTVKWQRKTGPLMQKYRDMGLIRDRAEQLQMLVDDFTLQGTETVAELNRRMERGFSKAKMLASEFAETGEKATGNKLAEEFNRFISANVMDQLTELAVKRNLMTPQEANAYINTFVNRVEGNLIASQRPLIFQGPIGQAISLFQSYQFNLLQQLLRYSAEGTAKDLAVLAGMQSTLYGLQSMPAFQFINTHIIGQLSGNVEHRDAYDATYGILGRTAGDFFLYGIPSNILQTNIYSRGDINPRQITVLPTNLQEIPIVQGWGKFLGSMYETFKKVKGGANIWESVLQGVEHNGISRPLAGLAQTFQSMGPEGSVYSTTNKGSILYSHDLLALATLSRLAGGRPLDEAVTNDALFRIKTYEAARRNDMLGLAERVKSTLIQGNAPDENQILTFAQRYAELGGKQAGFNKWMMSLYKSANVSQSDQLKTSLTNPFAKKMQLLMGGEEE